jgi:hypothetical protein
MSDTRSTPPPATPKADDTPDARVLSYLAVRRALGFLGLLLPAALYLYARVLGYGMQPSISEFYHTHMGDFLVGCLVAIGVFLIAYKGYPRQPGESFSDQWVSTIAGLGAIGVAFFPVVPLDLAACPPGGVFPIVADTPRDLTCPIQGFVTHWTHFAWIHFASAAVFFLCLAVFCFFLFPKGDLKPDGSIDWSAPNNRVYLICGSLLVASIVFLGLYAVLPASAKATLGGFHYIFWWETVGVVAFAISWLTKGKLRKGVVELISPEPETS